MSKNIDKMQKLEEKLTPLIDKIIYCDGTLFKIKDFSFLKLSGEAYECDKVLELNTGIAFVRFNASEIYKHFTNKVNNKKFKMLHSKFYNYIVFDSINDIDNKYFVNTGNQVRNDYHTSHFKNDKLQFKQDIEGFIYSMVHGQMNQINSSYYYPFRKKYLREQFNIYSFSKYKDEIKQLISKDNFIFYLKLYVEYKIIFTNELHPESIPLLKEKNEKLIKELQDEITILRNEEV